MRAAHPGLISDEAQIERFVSSLFRHADDGTFVSLRAFDQFERGKAPVLIDAVPVDDRRIVVRRATAATTRAANAAAPAVFAPPVATFLVSGSAKSCDLANGLTVAVELDAGNTAEKMRKLEAILGPATLFMKSGGECSDPETGEIFPKVHAHWRLSEPTRTVDDHAALQHARWLAATLVGGDMTAAPPVHPLRWAGSWNCKAEPKLATIAKENPDAEIHLSDALATLQDAVEAAGLASDASGVEKASAAPQAALARVQAALALIPNVGDWHDWNRIGMATWAATGGSADGLLAFSEWSTKSSRHDEATTSARWKHYASSPPSRIGAGTLIHLAKVAGWNGKANGEASVETSRAPDWDDIPPPNYEPEGPSADDEPFARGRAAGPSSDSSGWSDPVDFLSAENTSAPVLGEQHIPEAVWRFVADTAARMGVDPTAVALSAIVSCASVITDDWAVQPKRHDTTWTECPRIWGAIVGDPSILKTPVISAATKPIDKMEADARKRHAEAMRQWRADEAKAKLDKAILPPQPKLDRFMVEGSTPEALSEVLRDDDEAKMRAPAKKVLSRHDEMSEFFGGLDRYKAGGKGGSERGAYLRLYNGGRYTVDRIGRGSFAVPNWSACFLGGVQPGPIQRIAREAADDGLLQRFIYCVPDRQSEGLDREPDHGAVQRYEALFPALAALPPAPAIGGDRIRPVVFHADAHSHRLDIDALSDAMAAMPDTSARLKAAFGKWRGLFARLCLTFHLIDAADVRVRGEVVPVLQVITEPTARRVAAFMREIVLPHLLRADAVMFATDQTGHARWIAGYILAKKLERITTRDIVRDYRAFSAPEARREVDAVMLSLVSVGWLEPEENSNPAKGCIAWQVNPAVHTQFAERAMTETARRARAREKVAEAVERARNARRAA